MLPVTMRSCRTASELMKDIAKMRHISKTASAPNIEPIAKAHDLKMGQNLPNKWSRLNKHNNNRALSTIQMKTRPQSINYNIASKDLGREFMAVFPDIVRDLTDAGRQTDIPEVRKRYAKVLHYNVPNGKKTRGLAVLSAYKMFERPENITPENLRLGIILGWCVEMLQSYFLVTDDVMDGAETRRGKPCWYKEVGLSAINDGHMIQSGIYTLLRKHLRQNPCYLNVTELFHDATMKTEMGQALDLMTGAFNGRVYLDNFTMNKYDSIVKYKAAYYTFHLPVALAMYLANVTDEELHRQAKTILLEMGRFFQIQDDFLDCFGDPQRTGKQATDIREGKCSWLAVVALQRATPAQRQIMEQYYGKPDDEAVKIIRNLYEELGLPNTYAIYEEETYNIILTHIQQISKGLPHELFFKLMEKLYRRES